MASYRPLPPRAHFRRSEVQSGIQLAPLAAFLTSLNTAQHLVKLGDILQRYRTPNSYHRIDHRIVESSELPPSPSVFETEADTEKLERRRLELGEPIIDDDEEPGRKDEDPASAIAGESTEHNAPKAPDTEQGDRNGDQANGADVAAATAPKDPNDLTALLPLAEVVDDDTNPNDRSAPSAFHSPNAAACAVDQAELAEPGAASSHARRLTSVPLSRDASGAMALFYLSRGANEVPTTPDTLPSSEQLSEAAATRVATATQASAAPAHTEAAPADDYSLLVPNGFPTDVDVGLSPPVDPLALLSLPQLLNPLVEPDCASQPLEGGSTLGRALMSEGPLALTSDLTARALANIFTDGSLPLIPPESPVCDYPLPESGTARINREMRIDLRTLDPAALWALEVWRREVLELPAVELVVPQSKWFVQPGEPDPEPTPKKKRGRPRKNPLPDAVDLTATSPPHGGAGVADGDLPNDPAGVSGEAGLSSLSMPRTPSPALALPIGFDGDDKDDDDFEPTPRRAGMRSRGAPRGRPRGRGRGHGRASVLSDGGRTRTQSADPSFTNNENNPIVIDDDTPAPPTVGEPSSSRASSRGRGRPRKNPEPTAEPLAANGDNTASPVSQRKRALSRLRQSVPLDGLGSSSPPTANTRLPPSSAVDSVSPRPRSPRPRSPGNPRKTATPSVQALESTRAHSESPTAGSALLSIDRLPHRRARLSVGPLESVSARPSPADVGNDSSLQSRTPTPSTRTFARKLVSKHDPSIHLTAKHSGQSSRLEPPGRVPSRPRKSYDLSSDPLASMSDVDPISVSIPQPTRSRHRLSSDNDAGAAPQAPPPPARHLLSYNDDEAVSEQHQQQLPLSHQFLSSDDVTPMPRPSRPPRRLSRHQLSSDDEDEDDTGHAGGSQPVAPGSSQSSGPRRFAELGVEVERDPSPDFITLDFPPSPKRPHKGPFKAFNPPPMAVAARRTLPTAVRKRDSVPIRTSSRQSRSGSTASRSFNRMETPPQMTAARTRRSLPARLQPEPTLERGQTLLRPTKTTSKKRRHDSEYSDDASPPPILEPSLKRMRQFIDYIEVPTTPSRHHIKSSQQTKKRLREPSESPILVDDSSCPEHEIDEVPVEPARKSPARKTVRKTVWTNPPSRKAVAKSPEPPRKAVARSPAPRKTVPRPVGPSWKVSASPNQPMTKQVGRKAQVGVQGAAMRFSAIAPALLKAQARKEEAARAVRRLIEPDSEDEEDEWETFKDL